MTNSIELAYKFLESIKDDDDKETIYKKASAAYKLDDECLEALIIMSKCLDDIEEKEKILKAGIEKKKELINQGNYRRLVYELAKLYEDYGKNKAAIAYFNLLNELDVNNEYHSNYHLATLFALLEDDRILSLVSIEDDEIKLLFPYMMYLYKINEYVKAIEVFKKIDSLNPYFYKVLSGESDEDSEINENLSLALKILSFNSVVINSCQGFISYIVNKREML